MANIPPAPSDDRHRWTREEYQRLGERQCSMKLSHLSLVLLIGLLLVASGSFASIPAQAKVRRPKPAYTYLPDKNVRALVTGIHFRQVVSVEFFDLPHGLSIPSEASDEPVRNPSFEPIVTDPRLISRFLQALQAASDYNGPHLTISHPSVQINFRQSGTHLRQPLEIEFNDAEFGPKFQKVMDSLPSYLTKQWHRRLRSVASQVRQVDFAGLTVTDAAKVAQIVHELAEVDKRAFDIWYSDTNFEVKLLLKGGKSLKVVLAGPSPNSHDAPLPSTLLAYYKRVNQSSKSR